MTSLLCPKCRRYIAYAGNDLNPLMCVCRESCSCRWVKFEERKPAKFQKVIVVFINEYDKQIITLAEYIPPKEVLAEDYLGDDCDNWEEYDEEKDCFWALSGFYECQYGADIHYFIDNKVTHWMEMPKAPESGSGPKETKEEGRK